jgi:hypothetical protein
LKLCSSIMKTVSLTTRCVGNFCVQRLFFKQKLPLR